MAAPAPSLVFDTSFSPEAGHPVEIGPGLVRITAPNTGPYTFTGTNSFLIGRDTVVVIDPGPADDRHLEALMRTIAGRAVEAILLTHTHKDHCSLVPRLRAATKAPVWFEGRHRPSRKPRPWEMDGVARSSDRMLRPERTLRDGETLDLVGMTIEVIATPGHCANHLAFGLPAASTLLTGDHVMGWNSTLVPVPDGSMSDYLASLRKVIALPYGRYLPAHGGPIADGRGYARALLAHREARNAQVVAAIEGGAKRIAGLLAQIYPGLKLQLVPAALMTLKAHVEYLEGTGAIRVSRGILGTRLSPA